MSASVIPLIGRLTAVEPGSGEPEAIPVTLPAAPVEHIRAEEAGNAEPLGTACSIAEDSLIFPALVGEVEACELLRTLCTVLGRTLQTNSTTYDEVDNEDCVQPTISPFHGHRIPPISMGDYVLRISKYSKCSNICSVMAYSYMQRLAKRDVRFVLCPHNAHRMYLASVLLAAKLMDDNVFNNPYWAKIGGVSTGELHELELFALQQLEYRLCISPDEVATRLRELKVLAHSRAAMPVEASGPPSGPPPLACMAAGTSPHRICAKYGSPGVTQTVFPQPAWRHEACMRETVSAPSWVP